MGVFDNNAAAQDYIIKDEGTGGLIVTQIKTGGKTDRYFFLPTNLDHMQLEFGKLIGLPSMVPEWALGWHQCRYGYSFGQLSNVYQNYNRRNLPLDAIWSDIDYMQDFEDFTVGDNYPIDNFIQLLDLVHGQQRYWVPILDAGIKVSKDKGAY